MLVREVKLDKTYGDLEYCPFCDSIISVRVIERCSDQNADEKKYQIACSRHYGGCGSYSGECEGKGAMKKAVDLWNRRYSRYESEARHKEGSTIFKDSDNPQTNRPITTSIEELDFSVRSFNCLKRVNINTIEDLISKTKSEVAKIRNLGQKSLEEILLKLAGLDLSLSADEE